VGVLSQVGTGFVAETVGEVHSLAHGSLRERSVP
jgi:hypothetical protein